MGPIDSYRLYKLYKLIREGIADPHLFTQYWYWKKLIQTALSIKEIRVMLQGYKTYIVAVLLAILAALKALGYIDEATYQALIALLGAGAVSTVAAKINRIQKDMDNRVGK